MTKIIPLLACLSLAVIAAPASGGEPAPQPPAGAEMPKPAPPMDMNQPMTTGMMKKGMTMGDVKKAAEKRARELAPMMEQEEKSMPPVEKAKP